MMLAENLQILRKQNGLSQEELAEKCQVSIQAIAKWESGESVPTIEKLIYLAGLYEVTLDELVGRIVIDKYAKAMEYIKEFAADDIPTVDEDDISAFTYRNKMVEVLIDSFSHNIDIARICANERNVKYGKYKNEYKVIQVNKIKYNKENLLNF